VKTPVHQLIVVNPDCGVTAVLYDLLHMELPTGFPDTVAVPWMEVASDRSSDIKRMLRKGRVFSRQEFVDLLEGAYVGGGWFFFGAPGAIGDPVLLASVLEMLGRSAFVVDILEGNWLHVRTIIPSVAEAARAVIVGVQEIGCCELDEVGLTY
jgi:hypothetical protein